EIYVCGAAAGGGQALFAAYLGDEWLRATHSFPGNFTGCDYTYVCTDAGAILQYTHGVNAMEIVFQAPEGVFFRALVGSLYGEELVALGDGGAIFHRRDGGGFVDESIPDGPDFVAGSFANQAGGEGVHILGVGEDEIWSHDAGVWTKVYDFADQPLKAVHVKSDGYGIAAGDGGLVLREDEGGWWDWSVDEGGDLSAVVLNHIDQELGVCGTSGQIYLENNLEWTDMKHHAQGPWPAFHHSEPGKVYAANGNKLFRLSGDWDQLAEWDWGDEIVDLHVLAENDIWAIGVTGDGVDHFVLHFDGASWAVKFQTSLDGLNALWCDTSGDNVYVASDYGAIWWLHDDIREMAVGLGTPTNFYDLSGTTELSLRAVGDGGLIMRWGAESWTAEESGTAQSLRAISGPVAVGDGGTVLVHDGDTWNAADLSWDVRLNGVWSDHPDNIWAVGEGAFVLHHDGTDWTRLVTDLPGIDFLSVQGIGPDDVWIGGTEGYLLKNPTVAN
ncbi:MAG: hypothetical protein ABFS42_09370, partial [Candidatus Krumholzibacteriota bacterium]